MSRSTPQCFTGRAMLGRRHALLAGLFISLGVCSPAQAAGPEAFLKGKQAELTRALKDGDGPESDAKLARIFDTLLDYDTLAKRSLAEHWDDLDEKRRKQFTETLTRLVQRAYKGNIKKTLHYDVSYKGEDKAKDGFLVRTVARNRDKPRQEPISVDYVLHQVAGSWRVFDIVTEGSSLVQNYKHQFRRVIKKHGFEGLLRRMQNKLDEGK